MTLRTWLALILVLAGTTAVKADDIAVQTRGPIHEAFAQPYDAAPAPGVIVPKAPPAPVPELPPDQKPEGDNVTWIPGYWSWNADAKDYVWVSGFWRAVPPDRQWVAGYWRQTDDGWQWVPGYWAPAGQEQPPLLDTPPAPLDAGPSVPAPDDNSLYVPGCWVWRSERYLWRPGFWRPARAGWVWSPAHYAWTPGGCVYVDGYWDYPLETRGVLFAPVVFNRPLWRTPGWAYRPNYAIAIDAPFFASLFVRPSAGCYYFGDYYDPGYLRAGYEPWCQYGPRFRDPLYSYYRWAHRDDRGWLRGMTALYAGRRDGTLARPPHTLAEQTAGLRRAGGVAAVRPLSEFRGGRRLTTLSSAQVAQHQTAAHRPVETGRQRGQLERAGRQGPAVLVPSAPSHRERESRALQSSPRVHEHAAVQHHESHPAAPHRAPAAPRQIHAAQAHAAPHPTHARAQRCSITARGSPSGTCRRRRAWRGRARRRRTPQALTVGPHSLL